MHLALTRGAPFERFTDRLRQTGVPATVPSSLPVLFFGSIATAGVATIGLNPSRQEYLSASGSELNGAERRFETLGSLQIRDRASIESRHALLALDRMAHYFDPGSPAYAWFRPLARVVEGFGASYPKGSAVHLDLVQESTDPVWNGLWQVDPEGAESLLRRDVTFLRWQLEAFPVEAVLCTSRTVLDTVATMCDLAIEEQGCIKRVRWSVGAGRVRGRRLAVAGWNLPLSQPTGLTREEQYQLGSTLRRSVDKLGRL